MKNEKMKIMHRLQVPELTFLGSLLLTTKARQMPTAFFQSALNGSVSTGFEVDWSNCRIKLDGEDSTGPFLASQRASMIYVYSKI